MSKNRIKVALPTIQTRDEAEAVMNDLANIANNKRKFIAKMDAEVLEAQERYAPNIAACDDALKSKTDALRVWAESHPEEFGKKKSVELMSGILGFRTGTPKLALLNRAWNWEKVLEQVRTLIPAFVREKPEVDKEALLNQRDEEIIRHVLPRVGLKVVQDESFYVEPKLSATEAKLVQEAA